MPGITRRELLQHVPVVALALAGSNSISQMLVADDQRARKFTLDLRCSSLGVAVDQPTAVALANKFGFESVAAQPTQLADLSDDAVAQLVAELKEKKLVWGAADLDVEFRRDESSFADGVKRLPGLARGLQRAGVTRVGTWLSPAHGELTYIANFRQHQRRLAAVAKILGDHGLRLGLEYVGPKTSWASKRFSFIHTLTETKELIAEIGLTNIGLVLDSWHWYTAQESVADILKLSNRDVIACDLNDAPAGLTVDQQIDNRRELPSATGVINLNQFLSALVHIGYDGPVRAEPFNKVLNNLSDEAAVAATAKAMRKAFASIDS